MTIKIPGIITDEYQEGKHQICTAESLERVCANEKYVPPIKMKIRTDIMDVINGVFDSGSSLNCINNTFAEQHYGKYIKKTRGFYARTAGGKIIINKYIPIKVKPRLNSEHYIETRWYLIKNLPHTYIISRSLFVQMGCKVVDADGCEFTNISKTEEISQDLYGTIYDQLEYELPSEHNQDKYADPTSIINYINHNLKYGNFIPGKFKQDKKIHHVCTVDKEMVDIQSPNEKDIEEDIQEILGNIKNKNLRKQMEKMIQENKSRYATSSADTGRIPDEEFEIKIKPDTNPYHSKPYPHSYKHTDEIERQCQELLQAGFIRRSKSEWASPVIMVPKPTRKGKKEWRMCVDYRGLNQRTIKDRYRIPSMRDLYRKLRGNQVFSNFDLRSGYYHVSIKEEDRHKTAFITDGGIYEWCRMSFGFCNAPATFQRIMDRIFAGLDFVVIYLDDIIVCSKNEQEHLHHLQQVFSRLQEYNIKLRLEKCKFFQEEIKYLGIIVNKDGIKCDANYVDQILKFKKPTNSKEVERFIGMVTWLGRFIPNLSKITAKINELKGKNEQDFIWTEEHNRYFDAIIAAVADAKILRHPDLTKPFFVQTDASSYAIGAVLLQDFGNGYLEPIEFASRKFNKNEQNWHVSEKELVAVVWALQKWIRYLLPNHFTVFTDHKNLEELFKKGPSKKLGKLQRWIILLQQYDFTAKYLQGKDNYIADYISRDVEDVRTEMLIIETTRKEGEYTQEYKNHEIIPIRKSKRLAQKTRINMDERGDGKNYGKEIKQPQAQFKELEEEEDSEAQKEIFSKLHQESWEHLDKNAFIKQQKRDKEIEKLKQKIKENEQQEDQEYILNDEGIVFKKNKYDEYVPVVPKELQKKILAYFHTSNSFHHQGIQRTVDNIKRRFYWSNILQDVTDYCNGCKACQVSKARREKCKGKIIPIMASRPFEKISMDLVGPLPFTRKGNRYLLTIMDRFTRFVSATPLSVITTKSVAEAILTRWIWVHGPPVEILSDNGTQFRNKVFKLICKVLGVSQAFTTAYRPECNGMIERFHRFLKERLAIKGIELDLDYWNEDSWDVYIPSIVYAYNSSIHSITRYSPFELLYGQKPRLPIQATHLNAIPRKEFDDYQEYLRTFIKELEIIRNKTFKIQWQKSSKLEQNLNKERKDFDFKIGELVLRYIGDQVQGNKAKLLPKYEGPYEIIKIYPKGVTFVIQDVKQPDTRLTIHGSKLAKYKIQETQERSQEKTTDTQVPQ